MRAKAFAAQATIETVKTTTLHLTGADILKLLRLPEEGSTVESDAVEFDVGPRAITSVDPVVVTVQAKTSRTKGGDHGDPS